MYILNNYKHVREDYLIQFIQNARQVVILNMCVRIYSIHCDLLYQISS